MHCCQLKIHQNTVRNDKFDQSNVKAAKGSILGSIYQNKTSRWLTGHQESKIKNNNRAVLIKFQTKLRS